MASYENHLQFAFPGPYDESLKFNTFAHELSNVDEVIVRVSNNAKSANVDTNPIKVYVNTFIDDNSQENSLDINTDYFTYMLLNDEFIGSFSGIVVRVPAPTGYNVVSLREPNNLQLRLTFNEETIGGVPFDVFVQIGNVDFTNVSPDFSNNISRTFDFTVLPDGSLIDTVTPYTAHVYVVNKHSSNITTTFNVQGTPDSQLDSFNIVDFELVSMGNLDTDDDISLSVDFTPSTDLSNVTYYITANSSQGQSQAITILEMIQLDANVETGTMVAGLNTVVITKDFQGNPFEKNGNIDIKGLFIHEDTNKQFIMELTNITMDVPVIDANVFAAPMFKI